MGCSKSIISEEAVKGLGIHIEEKRKTLNIISASGDKLSIVGVADVFIKTQMTGMRKKLIQCCVLRGNRQSPSQFREDEGIENNSSNIWYRND